MFLKYVTNEQFERFINSINKSSIPAQCIIMPCDNTKKFVDVFTNLLNTQFRISDFECINVLNGAIYSKQWRQFMIKHLDKIDSKKTLSNQYIDSLHDYLEQDTIYGPTK